MRRKALNFTLLISSIHFLQWCSSVAANDGGNVQSSAVPNPPVAPVPVVSSLAVPAFKQASNPKLAAGGKVALSPTLVVNVLADRLDTSGAAGMGVSIREALRDVDDGGKILFDPSVFNSTSASNAANNTITLTLGELTLNKNARFDASALAVPVTLQGVNSRHVIVYPTKSASFQNFIFQGGTGNGPAVSGQGGALYNSGSLTLVDCRILGNAAATAGGGVFQYSVGVPATVQMLRCVVEGNSVGQAGAGVMNWASLGFPAEMVILDSTIADNITTQSGISSGAGVINYSTNGLAHVDMKRCTVQGNVASTAAGIINYANHANARCNLDLLHVTISGNHPAGGGSTAGLRSYSYAGIVAVNLRNSIIAGNTATIWPDVYIDSGVAASLGGNVIGINADILTVASDHAGTEAAPQAALLLPIGNYGGRSRTMPIRYDSVARNAGVATATATPQLDQRGYPMQGLPDSGAYEAGNPASALTYQQWTVESFPATTSATDLLGTADPDGDGYSNADEWLAGTVPSNTGDYFQSKAISNGNGTVIIECTSVLGRKYSLMASDNLGNGSFSKQISNIPGTGSPLQFNIDATLKQRQFFKVLVEP